MQVASFTGEKQAIAQYNQYCTYGLTIWFGRKMAIEKGCTGGQVISV